MQTYLDFEKPVADLEGKIEELRQTASADNGSDSVDIDEDVSRLREKASSQLTAIYGKLTPWQKTQVARHPNRPHMNHYINGLVTEFTPLAGDRYFGEDHAIVAGMARFRGTPVMIMGHEKGHDTESRVKSNFGMARPEGYRKVVRLLDLADRFDMSVISLVDTAGAYPGKGAEERGQAEAIARATDKCLSVGVPFVSVIVGEGGSGGAVAMASANKVLMLEHSIYSVISPEACSSIIWRSSDKAEEAAAAMKVTAQHLKDLKVIDGIIPEPLGGAHRDPQATVKSVGSAIDRALGELKGLSREALLKQRREKFLEIGRHLEPGTGGWLDDVLP